jgi:hypothetical protein
MPASLIASPNAERMTKKARADPGSRPDAPRRGSSAAAALPPCAVSISPGQKSEKPLQSSEVRYDDGRPARLADSCRERLHLEHDDRCQKTGRAPALLALGHVASMQGSISDIRPVRIAVVLQNCIHAIYTG